VRRARDGWTYTSQPALEAVGRPEARLEDTLAPGGCPRLYPDMPLDAALRLLGRYPLLPVASRTDPARLLGALTLGDVHRAYGLS
jgi:hypothetical protein